MVDCAIDEGMGDEGRQPTKTTEASPPVYLKSPCVSIVSAARHPRETTSSLARSSPFDQETW